MQRTCGPHRTRLLWGDSIKQCAITARQWNSNQWYRIDGTMNGRDGSQLVWPMSERWKDHKPQNKPKLHISASRLPIQLRAAPRGPLSRRAALLNIWPGTARKWMTSLSTKQQWHARFANEANKVYWKWKSKGEHCSKPGPAVQVRLFVSWVRLAVPHPTFSTLCKAAFVKHWRWETAEQGRVKAQLGTNDFLCSLFLQARSQKMTVNWLSRTVDVLMSFWSSIAPPPCPYASGK